MSRTSTSATGPSDSIPLNFNSHHTFDPNRMPMPYSYSPLSSSKDLPHLSLLSHPTQHNFYSLPQSNSGEMYNTNSVISLPPPPQNQQQHQMEEQTIKDLAEQLKRYEPV